MDASVQFVGNATTVLRLGAFTVLTDPNFLHRGQWAYLGKGLVSRRRVEPAFPVEALPPLDAVVLSHLHGDHFDRVARRGLDRDVPILCTHQAARRLDRWGFATLGLRTWQQHRMWRDQESLTITALPGVHAFGLMGRLLPPVMGSMLEYRDTPQARPLRIYLSGDTLLHDGLTGIAERFDEIDVAVLHLGGTRVLGVLASMDGSQGASLMELLRPALTVLVHFDDYGVFRSPLSDFREEVIRRDTETAVRYLQRGATAKLVDQR